VTSTVSSVVRAAGTELAGAVSWGRPVPLHEPGVYIVALTSDPASREGVLSRCPLDRSATKELLKARPELRLDRARPTPEVLEERVARFWLPDETVLYVGLAGTSVADRVAAYYRTPLGARRPHAGGWFLKLLANLGDLHVHFAVHPSPDEAEDAMLGAFREGVSSTTKSTLLDPDHPFPFANLEWPRGVRKRHGITGAREPRARRVLEARPRATGESIARPRAPGAVSSESLMRTQQVTQVDIERGRIRIPRGATKRALPSDRQTLLLDLRGEEFEARYDPRFEPPPERSGTLAVGRERLARLVRPGESLSVTLDQDVVRLA
jgi:hypothetical protein